MSGCERRCGGRSVGYPRERLDTVRRKLDYSDEVSESSPRKTPPSPERYGGFKKVAQKHSSREMLKPMYTSAELATVPQSFLDLFRSRLGEKSPDPQTKRKSRPPPPPPEEEEIEIPSSFLEFCQERIANRSRSVSPQSTCPGARTPRSASHRSQSPRSASPGTSLPADTSYCQPRAPPWGTSYSYMYENAGGGGTGTSFRPEFTSTKLGASQYGGRSPVPAPQSRPQPRTKKMDYSYEYPARPTTSPPIGIGKFACPASNSPPTPPTPSFLKHPGRTVRTSYTMETTVSSGDLADSPKRKSRSKSKCGTCDGSVNTSSPGYPLAQSTPHNPLLNYMRPNISDSPVPGAAAPQHLNVKYLRPKVSEGRSSLSVRKRNESDVLDTDDLMHSTNCPACPTLGVTPVQSSASVGGASSAESVSANKKRNISKSIEQELRAREEQERSQLEVDLLRWQQARRKLVMNTASMGS